MKKYFYIATIAAFMLSGCEDFLDTENYTTLIPQHYYKIFFLST